MYSLLEQHKKGVTKIKAITMVLVSLFMILKFPVWENFWKILLLIPQPYQSSILGVVLSNSTQGIDHTHKNLLYTECSCELVNILATKIAAL
jgi:hypothetical protein